MAPINKKQRDAIESLSDLLKQRRLPNFKPGTVIAFKRRFSDNGTVYQYAALLADNGRWYLTGRNSAAPMTLHQLVDNHLTAEDVYNVVVAVAWEQL